MILTRPIYSFSTISSKVRDDGILQVNCLNLHAKVSPKWQAGHFIFIYIFLAACSEPSLFFDRIKNATALCRNTSLWNDSLYVASCRESFPPLASTSAQKATMTTNRKRWKTKHLCLRRLCAVTPAQFSNPRKR